MSLLHPIHVAAIAAPMACVFAACSGSLGSGGTPGEGGASESVGQTAVSGTGVGGNEAVDAATFDAAEYCPGDKGAWQKLTAYPPVCQGSADCCVVMSGCLAQAQVVPAVHKDEVSAVWPYCDLDCVDCIPPAIEVGCVAGMCRGRVVPGEAPDSPLRQDHCGDDLKVVDLSGAGGLHFGCGG